MPSITTSKFSLLREIEKWAREGKNEDQEEMEDECGETEDEDTTAASVSLDVDRYEEEASDSKPAISHKPQSVRGWSIMEFLSRLYQQMQATSDKPSASLDNISLIPPDTKDKASSSKSENSVLTSKAILSSCRKSPSISSESKPSVQQPPVVTEISEDRERRQLSRNRSYRGHRRRCRSRQRRMVVNRSEAYTCRHRPAKLILISSKKYRYERSPSPRFSSVDARSSESSNEDDGESLMQTPETEDSSNLTLEESTESDMNSFKARLLEFIQRTGNAEEKRASCVEEKPGSHRREMGANDAKDPSRSQREYEVMQKQISAKSHLSSDWYYQRLEAVKLRKQIEKERREKLRLTERIQYIELIEEKRMRELDKRLEFMRSMAGDSEEEKLKEHQRRKEMEEWTKSMWKESQPCSKCQEKRSRVFQKCYTGKDVYQNKQRLGYLAGREQPTEEIIKPTFLEEPTSIEAEQRVGGESKHEGETRNETKRWVDEEPLRDDKERSETSTWSGQSTGRVQTMEMSKNEVGASDVSKESSSLIKETPQQPKPSCEHERKRAGMKAGKRRDKWIDDRAMSQELKRKLGIAEQPASAPYKGAEANAGKRRDKWIDDRATSQELQRKLGIPDEPASAPYKGAEAKAGKCRDKWVDDRTMSQGLKRKLGILDQPVSSTPKGTDTSLRRRNKEPVTGPHQHFTSRGAMEGSRRESDEADSLRSSVESPSLRQSRSEFSGKESGSGKSVYQFGTWRSDHPQKEPGYSAGKTGDVRRNNRPGTVKSADSCAREYGYDTRRSEHGDSDFAYSIKESEDIHKKSGLEAGTGYGLGKSGQSAEKIDGDKEESGNGITKPEVGNKESEQGNQTFGEGQAEFAYGAEKSEDVGKELEYETGTSRDEKVQAADGTGEFGYDAKKSEDGSREYGHGIPLLAEKVKSAYDGSKNSSDGKKAPEDDTIKFGDNIEKLEDVQKQVQEDVGKSLGDNEKSGGISEKCGYDRGGTRDEIMKWDNYVKEITYDTEKFTSVNKDFANSLESKDLENKSEKTMYQHTGDKQKAESDPKKSEGDSQKTRVDTSTSKVDSIGSDLSVRTYSDSSRKSFKKEPLVIIGRRPKPKKNQQGKARGEVSKVLVIEQESRTDDMTNKEKPMMPQGTADKQTTDSAATKAALINKAITEEKEEKGSKQTAVQPKGDSANAISADEPSVTTRATTFDGTAPKLLGNADDLMSGPYQLGLSILEQLSRLRGRDVPVKFEHTEMRGMYEPPTPYPIYLYPKDWKWLSKFWPDKTEEETEEEETEEEDESLSCRDMSFMETTEPSLRLNPAKYKDVTPERADDRVFFSIPPKRAKCERLGGVCENVRELRLCCPAVPMPRPSNFEYIWIHPNEPFSGQFDTCPSFRCQRSVSSPCTCWDSDRKGLYICPRRDWTRVVRQRPDVWAKSELDRTPNYISSKGDRVYADRMYHNKMTVKNITSSWRKSKSPSLRKANAKGPETLPDNMKVWMSSDNKSPAPAIIRKTDLVYDPKLFTLYEDCENMMGPFMDNSEWGSHVNRKYEYRNGGFTSPEADVNTFKGYREPPGKRLRNKEEGLTEFTERLKQPPFIDDRILKKDPNVGENYLTTCTCRQREGVSHSHNPISCYHNHHHHSHYLADLPGTGHSMGDTHTSYLHHHMTDTLSRPYHMTSSYTPCACYLCQDYSNSHHTGYQYKNNWSSLVTIDQATCPAYQPLHHSYRCAFRWSTSSWQPDKTDFSLNLSANRRLDHCNVNTNKWTDRSYVHSKPSVDLGKQFNYTGKTDILGIKTLRYLPGGDFSRNELNHQLSVNKKKWPAYQLNGLPVTTSFLSPTKTAGGNNCRTYEAQEWSSPKSGYKYLNASPRRHYMRSTNIKAPFPLNTNVHKTESPFPQRLWSKDVGQSPSQVGKTATKIGYFFGPSSAWGDVKAQMSSSPVTTAIANIYNPVRTTGISKLNDHCIASKILLLNGHSTKSKVSKLNNYGTASNVSDMNNHRIESQVSNLNSNGILELSNYSTESKVLELNKYGTRSKVSQRNSYGIPSKMPDLNSYSTPCKIPQLHNYMNDSNYHEKNSFSHSEFPPPHHRYSSQQPVSGQTCATNHGSMTRRSLQSLSREGSYHSSYLIHSRSSRSSLDDLQPFTLCPKSPGVHKWSSSNTQDWHSPNSRKILRKSGKVAKWPERAMSADNLVPPNTSYSLFSQSRTTRRGVDDSGPYSGSHNVPSSTVVSPSRMSRCSRWMTAYRRRKILSR